MKDNTSIDTVATNEVHVCVCGIKAQSKTWSSPLTQILHLCWKVLLRKIPKD